MPFVNAKCTNCGGTLSVDNTKDAWICDYCRSPFIVEKAINNYNVTNNNTIHANTVNIYGGNNVDFVIRGGVLEKYNGASTKAVIPNTVTHIGNKAFENCLGLTKVIIPDSVVGIGVNAFAGCSSLHSINIPESVVTIGTYAFRDCSSLENVKLPSQVTEYGGGLFEHCISLKSIVIPRGPIYIDGFSDCKSLTSVKLPDTVTYIRNNAFSDCFSLESITIPYGTEVLGCWAFGNCCNLKSIVIPDTVKRIDLEAFANCNKLTNINYKHLSQFADRFPAAKQRKAQGRCLYCGGKFSLLGKCKVCRRKKDY